jgi:uncharacterized membrane protein YoaK (UPF0700 family)
MSSPLDISITCMQVPIVLCLQLHDHEPVSRERLPTSSITGNLRKMSLPFGDS